MSTPGAMGRRSQLTGLLAVAAVTVVLRAPSFVYPIMDIDEGSYAAIACRMMTGGLPYRDGVENKFPAIFYLYTAVFGLFGRYDMRAVHAFAALAAFGTALAAGAIAANLARRRGADESAARRARWLAAILYAVFSTTYEPKLLAANTELFSVLPASLAVLVYLRARGRPAAFFATGALAGCALLFKQVAGLLLVALAADRLIRGLLRRDLRRSVTDVIAARPRRVWASPAPSPSSFGARGSCATRCSGRGRTSSTTTCPPPPPRAASWRGCSSAFSPSRWRCRRSCFSAVACGGEAAPSSCGSGWPP